MKMLSIKKTFAHLNVKRLYFAGEIISLPIGQSHFDIFLRQFKKKKLGKAMEDILQEEKFASSKTNKFYKMTA